MANGPAANGTANCAGHGSGDGLLEISEEYVEGQLRTLRGLVAQPIADTVDAHPAQVGEGLFVGNKKHATDVEHLVSLGVKGALNCAPTGISSLNLDVYSSNGITYEYTNVSQDNHSYPILHDRYGQRSEHLETAKHFYDSIRKSGGNVLFFCVAGQNRSATLAIAVQILHGIPLQEVLTTCASCRPWILENVGFQRQLVELEALERSRQALPAPSEVKRRRLAEQALSPHHVEVELLVSGLATMAAAIPVVATIDTVRAVLLERANAYLRFERHEEIGRFWLLFTKFGLPPEFDLVLEEMAVEVKVQIARLQTTFGLDIVKPTHDATDAEVGADTVVRWNSSCRFEVCIFSVLKDSVHEPFIFRHQERPGAPGTLLAENFLDTNLRSWDFASGEAFRSTEPIVFSYSDDPRSKRDFMNISTSKYERQQFSHPGEGGILGMGGNAIVHRVELEAVEKDPHPVKHLKLRRLSSEHNLDRRWDAAAKRPFSLAKMLAFMEQKSEAGVAKRLRMAGALNKQGRLLYFYGLGITLASNNNNHEEYKFEVTLLSQYQEDFSSYTLKQFMDDYTKVLTQGDLCPEEEHRIKQMQRKFTLIKAKVLLVSLLNGFRDLTLMGVQAFDFNHMNNVLISRDCRKCRLIDIDGNSKGSIQFPSTYIQGSDREELAKPALDVDLSLLLPVVVQQLICGKGRGMPFVTELISKVRRAPTDEKAKELIRQIVQENFFSANSLDDERAMKHLSKVVEWFFALLMKRPPWTTWTNDIYDAMRCIDHLPIS